MQSQIYSMLLLPSLVFGQLSPGDFVDLPATSLSTYAGTMPTTANAVRTVSWSHPYGNLLANWSFENKDQFWSAGTGASLRVSNSTASSGLHVAKAGSVAGDGLVSEPVLLKSGTVYTLSVRVRGTSSTGAYPKLLCTVPSSGTITALAGSAYQPTSSTNWAEQNWSFTIPSDGDRSTRIVLLAGTRPGSGAFLELDDVILSERLNGAIEVARDNILEAVSVSDPAGVSYHTATRSGADASYQLSASGYDNFWRPESSYLPSTVPLDQSIYSPQSNVLSLSRSSNPAAGSTPVSVVRYPDATRPGYTERNGAGDAWSRQSGRVVRSGTCAWPSLPASAADLPVSFETTVASPIEANYTMSWSRDADGNYSASWSDVRGRLLLSAALLDKGAGTNPSGWTWAFTRYEYYPTGQLKRILTPLSGTVTPVVTSYDMLGHVIAVKSFDEGLVRYWYDVSGQLRYRQKASQIPTNGYTYFAYDWLGRMVSEGEVTIPSMTQQIAETVGSEELPSKVERKGWIYDDLPIGWAARSNLPALTIVEGEQNYGVANASGRLVAKYHCNPQYTLGDLDAIRRLVAEFYDYDDRGRVRRVGKYIGAVADQASRRQNVTFTYDSAGRVDGRVLDRQMENSGVPDLTYVYKYDDKGRLNEILAGNLPLSSYTYDVKGRLVQVDLGDGNASKIRYEYNVQGLPQRIGASTNHGVVGGQQKLQYDQLLGYEAPAGADVPSATPVASYVGRITQVREQFGGDINVQQPSPTSESATQPLKTTNYTYDAAGRMVASTVWTGTNAGLSQGDVAYADEWTLAAELGGYWWYDANSRISQTRMGGLTTSASYQYQSGGNRLSNVVGTLTPGNPRDLSGAGALTYDPDGNLVADNSKAKWAVYDAEGLPEYIGWNTPGGIGGTYIWPLYDADGQMSSSIVRNNNPSGSGPTERVHYIRMAGAPQKEIREIYSHSTGSLTNTVQVVNLIGQSAVIGCEIDGNRYYYLKNHQGSIMKVVAPNGMTIAAYDYSAYGEQRVLKDPSQHQTQTWTGKEYFAAPGLYYFGARWYDPELGLWISPDPAHQFNSPYAYGYAPNMGLDPDGEWLISLAKIVFTPVGVAINLGSAINAGLREDSFGDGLKAFGTEFGGSTVADYTAVASAGGGLAWGLASDVGNLGISGYMAVADGDLHRASRRMEDFGKATGVALWSPLVSDFNTLNNSVRSLGDGDLGGAFSSLGSSGVNSTATSYYAAQYSANKGFGSQQYKYYGSNEDGDGYRANVWGQSTNDGNGSIADYMGGNVRLYKQYYSLNPTDKARTYRHEMYHNRQQIEYGFGGMVTRRGSLYSKDNPPGMFGYSSADIHDGVEHYGRSSEINELEIEAVMKGGQVGYQGGATYEAPIFY